MKIRLGDSCVVEASEIVAYPHIYPDGRFYIPVSYKDPWHFARLKDGTCDEENDDYASLGYMSTDKFASGEEAERAVARMIEHVFKTGQLDLRNALEDWGLVISGNFKEQAQRRGEIL